MRKVGIFTIIGIVLYAFLVAYDRLIGEVPSALYLGIGGVAAIFLIMGFFKVK